MLEKVKKYVEKNSNQLLILSFVFIGINFLGRLPYLNIFLNLRNSVAIIFLLSIVLLKLKAKHFAFFTVLLFIAAVIFNLISPNEPKIAEVIGNGIYGLIVLWVLFGFFDYLKFIKKRKSGKILRY